MEIVIPAALSEPVCRDPDDDVILATAVAGRAQSIVTGDKDLLVLVRFGEIVIVAPAAFSDIEKNE